MRLSKRSSTSAALAICIVLPMFYYNIFHLMSNVTLKSKVYGQTVYYNKVDDHKEINRQKESDGIKKDDNYTDNDYRENYSYKDESDESERYLIIKYNFIDSDDNIINEEDSKENDDIKENYIESDRRDDNKIEYNEAINNKIYENKINVDHNNTQKIEKTKEVNRVKDVFLENNNTTTNIYENNTNTIKEKPSNDIKTNEHNIEKVNINYRSNTTGEIKVDSEEKYNKTKTTNVQRKNNTEDNVRNTIAETGEKINANHGNYTEGKSKNEIKEKKENTKTINVNHETNAEEKVKNNTIAKDEQIETVNANPKNNTAKKVMNGIKGNETINPNYNNNTEAKVRNEKNEEIKLLYINNNTKEVSNGIKEKNETIETINVNSKNDTKDEVKNDVTENIKILTVSAIPKNNTEENVKNDINEKANITNKKDIKLQLHDHAHVTLPAIQEPNKDFIINTPGCVIPDYGKTMIFNEAADKGHTCGTRAVFIDKVDDDEVIFRIDEKKMNKHKKGKQNSVCCYKYVSRPTATKPGIQDTKVTYSPCELFKNNTKIKLKQEIIVVTCGDNPVNMSKIIYEDVYTIVKKVKKDEIKDNKRKSWNVLIVGMDTMSRARAYKNMPLTMQYFQENDWLDYRGYQKVGYNTFPNLMALLTGKTNVYSVCRPSMDHCNDLFIWTQYRNASYATAYGEDFLSLPDTFKNYGGFEIPPTDHYMRPFYLTGEHVAGNLVCSKQIPSAVSMLKYVNYFAQTYKDKNFFGMFWINSYSHNDFNTPALFDQHTREFFEELPKTDTLNNTFIIFLSDHGIRYGEMRYSVESYYEERLPMFYMWVPHDFRKDHSDKYNSLKQNQYRLTTPYDLHATLWEILKMSRDSVTVIKPEACPNCTSLFEEKSLHRTCADAAVDKKWCSCHKLEPVDMKDSEGKHCLELAVSSIQNITKQIKTIECTRCSTLRLKKALRIHSYYDNANNKTYFVVAFLLSPGDVGYEVTIEKDNNGYNIVAPTTTITAYNTRGDCTVKKLTDRPYCVCENIPKCHKKPNR